MEILLAIAVFAVCLLALGVGALLKGRCLRGSCGGESVRMGNESIGGCASCSKRETNQCATPVNPVDRTRDS